MLVSKPVYRTSRFWRSAVPGGLFLLWLAFFWRELALFIDFFAQGLVLPFDPFLAADYRRSTLVILVSFFAFVIYFFVYLWLVSQFLLPVQKPSERRRIFERLTRYLSAAHGPAVFIREGQAVGTKAELLSSLPGVAFVDVKSAIVLENQSFVSYAGGVVRRQPTSEELLKGVQELVEGEEKDYTQLSMARAAGPGLVFTSIGERIRGMVSLRRQTRIQPNVTTLSRDGFEVSATVVTIFTLGESPEVIRVGYAPESADDPNPFRPENLRAILIDEKTNTILGFREELDLADQREVHLYAQRANPSIRPVRRRERRLQPRSPYIFDPERVFKAVYSDARRTNDDSVENWLDMPLRVAVETFHNMIASERYSDLYMPKDPKAFPLFQDFRPRFSRAVRNQGVLSFQLVLRKDDQPLAVGQIWEENDLEIFPVQSLRGAKVLRDRGIRVIAATFSELKPVKPEVRQQLLDYWRARRDHQADLTRAPYDYQEVMVRARARALAQREIVESLHKILEDTSITSETMAVQVLQALEGFAKDPATEKLLPGETLTMMSNLQNWLWRQK